MCINIKKSTSTDGIPNGFLYRYSEWLAKYLTIIFQSSISQSSFSRAWKQANIVPIHKGSITADIGNYRFIAFEHLLYISYWRTLLAITFQITSNHNLISSILHGFCKGLSTRMQFVELVHKHWNNNSRQTDISWILPKPFIKPPTQKCSGKLMVCLKKLRDN